MKERDLEIEDWIHERVAARLEDSEFKKRYERWLRLPETVEVVGMLRDVFCRPRAFGATPTGDQAIEAHGFQEGAWTLIDTMMTLRAAQDQQAEVPQNYDDGEDGKGRNKKAKGK